MKKLIKNFLKTFGRRVRDDEEDDYTELMMDDHICVNWKGKQYYIPENNRTYSENDELIYEFLKKCRHI